MSQQNPAANETSKADAKSAGKSEDALHKTKRRRPAKYGLVPSTSLKTLMKREGALAIADNGRGKAFDLQTQLHAETRAAIESLGDYAANEIVRGIRLAHAALLSKKKTVDADIVRRGAAVVFRESAVMRNHVTHQIAFEIAQVAGAKKNKPAKAK